MDGDLRIEWKDFSLEQVNAENKDTWKVWEQPEISSRSLSAFMGAEAARRQGNDAFERFHFNLFAKRHEQHEDLDRDTVVQVAEECGLDMERFLADLDSDDITDSLARDHEGAVEKKVFGTPTIFFSEDASAYLRMMPASTGNDALQTYQDFRRFVVDRPNVAEIKRPE